MTILMNEFQKCNHHKKKSIFQIYRFFTTCKRPCSYYDKILQQKQSRIAALREMIMTYATNDYEISI